MLFSNSKAKQQPVMRTGFTKYKHINETCEERLTRIEHLFDAYLGIRTQLKKHTIADLDVLLEEQFKATICKTPHPLSQFEDENLSSLGEDEFVTEEDIVRVYQITDKKVIQSLVEKEKESINYGMDQEYQNSLDQNSPTEEDKVASFLSEYKSMSKKDKKELFSDNYKKMSLEEKMAIYDDEEAKFQAQVAAEVYDDRVYIIFESKDGKYVSGQTMQIGLFCALEAMLFIAQCDEMTENDWNLSASYFQQYLEALVWSGWIEDSNV